MLFTYRPSVNTVRTTVRLYITLCWLLLLLPAFAHGKRTKSIMRTRAMATTTRGKGGMAGIHMRVMKQRRQRNPYKQIFYSSTMMVKKSVKSPTKSRKGSKSMRPKISKAAPTTSPSAVSTVSPTMDGSPSILCQPTTDSCAMNEAELRAQLDAAASGDVVAICAGTTIDLLLDSALSVTQDELTLCCDGYSADNQCGIHLFSNSIEVSSSTFSLVGIVITIGTTSRNYIDNLDQCNPSGLCEGQILIEDSSFRVEEDVFVSLLVIRTTGDVIIRNSAFVGGADNGLEIREATTVTVNNSSFLSNRFSGLLTEWICCSNDAPQDSSTNGQQVEITNSVFADLFTGYVASNLGTLPRISIVENSFSGMEQGVVTLCCSDNYGSLNFTGNEGSNNQGVCPGLNIFNSQGETCLPVDEDYVIYDVVKKSVI